MIMSLFRRASRNRNQKIVDTTFASIVAGARNPVFFADWGVPDTPLGRFEAIGLHLILYLHRMRGAPSPADELSQDVLDEFFREVDHSIRELGVGDPSVPKRMKKLARMFYGRMERYWTAIDAKDAAALGEAVAKNVAPETPETIDGQAISGYMMRAADHLAAITDDELFAGTVRFPEPVAEGVSA